MLVRMLVNVSQLRPADIIVSTTGATVSGAIRASTGSSVSHSMIYVGDQFVVEAISQGVVKRLLSLAIQEATLAIALRRRNLTSVQATAARQHAEDYTKKGLPYDSVGAAGAGTALTRGRLLAAAGCGLSLLACGAGAVAIANNSRAANADTAFFCSELVARVFELAGAPIVDSAPSFSTPRQVRMSPHLLYLGHLKDT